MLTQTQDTETGEVSTKLNFCNVLECLPAFGSVTVHFPALAKTGIVPPNR